MKFSGLQKTSLLDYPDSIASVLFTPDCNLRCPYCHNWKIATNPQPPFLQEGAALNLLLNRKKYVDSIVITGGEPCMHKELPRFITKLKENGFSVKLDTNGFFPVVLAKCLDSVDYVAMDIKTSPEKYKQLGDANTTGFMRSVALLKEGTVPFEFRTTVVPEIVKAEDIPVMGELVKGAKVYALQQFVPDDTLDKRCQNVRPYAPEVLAGFAETLKKYVETVVLRI
jgi:pyruvate formate lyase activating enzyme